MASSMAFVAGTVRLEMNDRVSFFMERGFAPSVEVTEENTVVETVQVQFRGAVAANVNGGFDIKVTTTTSGMFPVLVKAGYEEKTAFLSGHGDRIRQRIRFMWNTRWRKMKMSGVARFMTEK